MKLTSDTLPGPISDDFGSQVGQPLLSQLFLRLNSAALDIFPASILELAQNTRTDFTMMFTSTSITTSMRPLFCSSTHAPGCCCCSLR